MRTAASLQAASLCHPSGQGRPSRCCCSAATFFGTALSYSLQVSNAYVELGGQHTKAVPKSVSDIIDAAAAQMKA